MEASGKVPHRLEVRLKMRHAGHIAEPHRAKRFEQVPDSLRSFRQFFFLLGRG
jgi:hypothetical protein